MKKGEIIFCKDFQFDDGDKGNKYFVVLNNPLPYQPFLAVLTTSQKKDRYDIPGCYVPDGYFFITQNTEWFLLPTWIKFNHIYEFPRQEGLNKEKQGIFKFRNTISKQKMDEIIKCLKMTYDINKDQIALLNNSLPQESLQVMPSKL